VIADVNAYNSFVTTLRQSSVYPYFRGLQMAANLYIVESPKDLAGLVKDVQRYEGTLRSEEYVIATDPTADSFDQFSQRV